MSIKSTLQHYNLIINRLKRNPYSSFEEIKNYVENQFEELGRLQDLSLPATSKRTFNRVVKDINELFGIELRYSKKEKGYFINEDETSISSARLMEAFQLQQAIKLSAGSESLLVFQENPRVGNEFISIIIQAIKQKSGLCISHKKFWDEQSTNRRVVPYFLKEFKNRWYLIARDETDGVIKTFGLDRITEVQRVKIRNADKDRLLGDNIFTHAYGIICPDDQEPVTVRLSFTADQTVYIKSLPLHSSQKIITATKSHSIFELTVYITYDFIMELLSFGEEVKVLQPKSLIRTLKKSYANAIKQYDDKP